MCECNLINLYVCVLSCILAYLLATDLGKNVFTRGFHRRLPWRLCYFLLSILSRGFVFTNSFSALEMDELDHQKIFNKIIYKQLEPCVLNEEVIRNSVLEQGPRGEAGRIFKNMEIQYEKVTVLRLEFLSKTLSHSLKFSFSFTLSCLTDILKIDHLWILPNIEILSLAFNKIDKIENLETLSKLKELNLAFNSIEKLENLECLQCLEILNIFGNKIRKIENVDRLENLIIFSAGNNLIDTKDGVRKNFLLNRGWSLTN